MKPSDSSGSRPINVNPANWGQHSTSRPSRFLKLYDEIKTQPRGEASLWPIYNNVHKLQYGNQAQAFELLDALLRKLQNYSAPPDLWHNLSIVASRVDNEQAELHIVLHGLAQWPEDVDLLCDALELVHRSGEQTDPAAAEVIWNVLERMDRAITGPFWRFWVFGAQYNVRDRANPGRAIELLDEGLRYVQRDGLSNILNAYRGILIDAKPTRKLDSLDDVVSYQSEILRQLEDRYSLGIRLGVENGHVLAVALATLYQERAGEDFQEDADAGNAGRFSRSQNLDRALFYLKLAETLFTGSVNHNIASIYEPRARIMMVKEEYNEALRLMRSLPQTRQNDPNVTSMMRLASFSIGENPDITSPIDEDRVRAEALGALFSSGGEQLLDLARQSSQIRQIVLAVASQLIGSDPEAQE